MFQIQVLFNQYLLKFHQIYHEKFDINIIFMYIINLLKSFILLLEMKIEDIMIGNLFKQQFLKTRKKCCAIYRTSWWMNYGQSNDKA